MLVLGVDPAYRSFGYCLVKVNGTPELVTHGVQDFGNSKDWHRILQEEQFLKELGRDGWRLIDALAIEEIVWHGKRKGALALAHLVGAVIGEAKQYGPVIRLYPPRYVKEETARGKFPKDFSEHEKDALSLCRLYLNEKATTDKLVDPTPTAKRTPRKRARARR